MHKVSGVAVLLIALACAPEESARIETMDLEWPRLRGPSGNGAADMGSLAQHFGPASKAIWRVPVPAGRSSPVLVGARVYLTAAEGNNLATLCFDRASGDLMWRKQVQRRANSEYHEHNSPATPTPAVDGQGVVVFFPDFGLLRYDHDGGERWRVELGPFESKVGYGLGASPVIGGGLVVLPLDEYGRSTLLALDATSGEERWRVQRPSIGESWSTPVIVDGKEVVHVGSFVLESFDLASGERLRWTRGSFHEPIAGPVVRDGVAYLAGFGPAQDPATEIAPVQGEDADGDGRISMRELPTWKAAPIRTVALCGLVDDGDGFLDEDECLALARVFQHYIQATGPRSFCAIRLEGSDDVTDTSYLWSTRASGVPEVTLPVLVGQELWFVNDDGGVVTRLNRSSGEVLAQERVDALAGWNFASPVTSGGEVLFVTHAGTAVVLGPELQVRARLGLKDLCYGTPALGSGQVYLRSAGALLRFGR